MLPMPVSPDLRTDVPQIVVLRIWKDHVPADDKGNYKEVERVEWAKKGTNGATTTEKISRLSKPGRNGEINPVWEVVKPVYERWKQGQAEPLAGTPLDTWPAVTKGQVDHLRMLHVLTVEDVAEMNESAMERFGMGARVIRDKARSFIQAKQGEAVVAQALSEARAENADLREQLKELTETVAQLSRNMPKRDKPKDVAN